LRGLGLELVPNHGDKADMDLDKVILASSATELTQTFDERSALNVTESTAEFNDTDIGLLVGFINGGPSHSLNPFLDGVGQVWHDLDGTAKIVTASLFGDAVRIDLASGDVVISSESNSEVTI
jgi:hypothetical protein